MSIQKLSGKADDPTPEPEETNPTKGDEENASSSPDGAASDSASEENGDSADASDTEKTVQVPTALNPDTWPEETGTVTDPAILARHGLAPDEPPAELAGKPEPAPAKTQGEPPSGAEWFQCLVGNLPTEHTFWSKDHLAEPPRRVSCPECGSTTVVRSAFYKRPAFMAQG